MFDLVQPMFLQLHNLQLKVCPESILVELDPPRQPVDVGHLHVVDQRVAVLPGVVVRAAKGCHGNNLQNEQCFGTLTKYWKKNTFNILNHCGLTTYFYFTLYKFRLDVLYIKTAVHLQLIWYNCVPGLT